MAEAFRWLARIIVQCAAAGGARVARSGG